MLLELNFTLIVFALTFLVFINLLNLTLYKPVGEIIEKRKKLVEDDLNKASSSAKEASEAIENYQSQIKQARLDAQSIIHEVVGKTEKVKQEKISALLNVLSKEKEDALNKIKAEEKSTMEKLEGEIKILTDLITNQILGKEKDLASSSR